MLQPWILPTGNAFIKDPTRRFTRPNSNWGRDLTYVRPDFDDRAWERVNLPHDWAISGPFIANGPMGGVGRLPSPGVGWYRRKLTIPAGDAGRSIFLDVDGGAVSRDRTTETGTGGADRTHRVERRSPDGTTLITVISGGA